MEKQTIERGKLRKAVGRQGRMSNVGRSQGRKESMTGEEDRRLELKDLGVMGGGCGDGLRRGGEE